MLHGCEKIMLQMNCGNGVKWFGGFFKCFKSVKWIKTYIVATGSQLLAVLCWMGWLKITHIKSVQLWPKWAYSADDENLLILHIVFSLSGCWYNPVPFGDNDFVLKRIRWLYNAVKPLQNQTGRLGWSAIKWLMNDIN